MKRTVSIAGLSSLSGATAGQYTPIGCWGGALAGLILFLFLSSNHPKKLKQPDYFVGADGLSISPNTAQEEQS